MLDEEDTWRARAKVFLVDTEGNQVEGATVTFLYEPGSTVKTCTTNDKGKCAVGEKYSLDQSGVMVTVQDISHPTLSYDSAKNTDPDGDSDCLTVTIDAP